MTITSILITLGYGCVIIGIALVGFAIYKMWFDGGWLDD